MPRRSGGVVRYEGARGVVWRIRYRDADGRRVCDTVGLEAEGFTARMAEGKLIEALADVRRQRRRAVRPMTFSDFAEDAMTKYLDAKGRRRSTRTGYLAVVRDHLERTSGRSTSSVWRWPTSTSTWRSSARHSRRRR
jgi:hypothetical protein